jgi:hypothetical protein
LTKAFKKAPHPERRGAFLLFMEKLSIVSRI